MALSRRATQIDTIAAKATPNFDDISNLRVRASDFLGVPVPALSRRVLSALRLHAKTNQMEDGDSRLPSCQACRRKKIKAR